MTDRLKRAKYGAAAHAHEVGVLPTSFPRTIGPNAAKKERDKFARQILANPRNYMAQPMLLLSTAPTLVDMHAEPRHLDLRPFILSGSSTFVTTGGLTRVAQ